MVAFLYRMPSGIPGAANRLEGAKIEPGLLLAGFLPSGYGVAVAVDATSGRYRAIGAGDTANSVAGLLVRPFPSGSMGPATDILGNSQPNEKSIVDIMKSGYMTVLLGGVTAAFKGGPVFVRIATPSAGKPIGGFEAAADATNTIALDNKSYWMGPADAQGNCEISFNS